MPGLDLWSAISLPASLKHPFSVFWLLFPVVKANPFSGREPRATLHDTRGLWCARLQLFSINTLLLTMLRCPVEVVPAQPLCSVLSSTTLDRTRPHTLLRVQEDYHFPQNGMSSEGFSLLASMKCSVWIASLSAQSSGSGPYIKALSFSGLPQ